MLVFCYFCFHINTKSIVKFGLALFPPASALRLPSCVLQVIIPSTCLTKLFFLLSSKLICVFNTLWHVHMCVCVCAFIYNTYILCISNTFTAFAIHCFYELCLQYFVVRTSFVAVCWHIFCLSVCLCRLSTFIYSVCLSIVAYLWLLHSCPFIVFLTITNPCNCHKLRMNCLGIWCQAPIEHNMLTYVSYTHIPIYTYSSTQTTRLMCGNVTFVASQRKLIKAKISALSRKET